MSVVEESIDVSVPLSAAYNQWTQFEEFPQFMKGVKEVTQLTDDSLRWVAEIGGEEREWVAEITEQSPDERIAWRSRGGVQTGGVVTFHRLSDDQTKVMLQMEFDPQGFKESVADALGLVRGQVKGDLERFKTFIESLGVETGAWRGDIHKS